ncbi:MAG: DUF4838 domain-containing protein [Candidatus Spyradosoma sp.]
MKFSFFKKIFFAAFAGTALVCAASRAAEAPAEPLPLVADGVFAGSVFVAEDCDMGELVAAQDLADWIRKISGAADVRVRTENFADAANPRGIFVGKTLAAARAQVAAPAEGDESYVVAPRGEALFLVGKTPAATAHAAAKLLTRDFGAEFLFPGEDGAEWTPKKDVPFPREDFVCVPAWTRRAVALGGGDENAAWARRLGFGALPQFSHNLCRVFTPEIYAERPHLAPFCNGRVEAERRGGYAPQPNLANADAPRVALDAAKKYFAENPDAPMFSVGINDCFAWDESDESARVCGDAPMRWFRNLPNRSDYFWGFADATARALAATDGGAFAGKKISAIAYLDCQDAPTFRLAENVFPVLCADRSLWIFPEFETEDKALMRRWAASGVGGWGVYDYYYGEPFLFPRLFFRAEADSVAFAHAAGARLFYAEIFPQAPFDAPKVWLLAKLLENPRADADALLEEFCALAYGNAAATMREFFALCEEIWREQGGQCRWIKGWRVENSVEIFSADAREKCRTLLEAARKALPEAPEDARERRIVARLDAALLYWERAEAFAKSYGARKELETRTRALKTLEDCAAALESPAWNFEKIYGDVAWRRAHPDAGFAPCRMGVSDPRASAFVRVVDALRALPRSEERLAAERRLAGVLRALPGGRASEPLFRALVPALAGAPVFSENFEPRLERDPEDGEEREKSAFVALDERGWRRGKTVAAPASFTLRSAPAEDLFCGETPAAHSGESALKIAGACEMTELSRDVQTRPGARAALSVWARGRLSVGATAGFMLRWRDAEGEALRVEFARLSCGETPEWTRFVVAGTAPENAATLEILLSAGLFAPEDFVAFDDVELFEF